MDKLKKLHESVLKLEKHYGECFDEATKNNHLPIMAINAAECTVCIKIRWLIEELMKQEAEPEEIPADIDIEQALEQLENTEV